MRSARRAINSLLEIDDPDDSDDSGDFDDAGARDACSRVSAFEPVPFRRLDANSRASIGSIRDKSPERVKPRVSSGDSSDRITPSGMPV
jgi:hypothetical protein